MDTDPMQSPNAESSRPKGKRVSRACLSCRTRKTRCDLDSEGTSGLPPCRRCVEQHIECVLAKSRRGGRRIKGVRTSSMHAQQSDGASNAPARYSGEVAGSNLQQWSPDHASGNWRGESPGGSGSTYDTGGSRTSPDAGLDGHIATADILNPSDALDLLAQVADLDPGRRGSASTRRSGKDRDMDGAPSANDKPFAYYPPLDDGVMNASEAAYLLKRYHEKFHPFFPVAHAAIFDGGSISEWARKEPHLLTAILTVASKDDRSWIRVYDACSRYMEGVMSNLIYAGSTSVGSVEALLILAEWAPQRPQENSAIGCGQEDQGAWMLVGLAIRLGYLQRLEQSSLIPDDGKLTDEMNRKRVCWAACYMSDRQVSIRLGKGFWSRGPGPALHLRSADFPSLHAQAMGHDNAGLLFQAHLELIQLFSTSHDILYSSASHRNALYIGGEYVRYIDDFNAMLRKWKLTWANHTFTPPVKASLVLSFEYLRLYINAFAFQANLNRAASKANKDSEKPMEPLFTDLASKPDARFIYESIDAASSLLSILNSFVDPVAGLKCMPLKYCLYVIYAAVFLFKARLAGAISGEGDRGVRRAIHGTITQLQKMSNNPHSLGRRYATSLRLLWRKSAAKQVDKPAQDEMQGPVEPSPDLSSGPDGLMPAVVGMDPLNGFSWRDLDSLGQYIASNTSMTMMTDGTLTGTDYDWEHSSGGLDDLTMQPQFETMWNNNDLVF